MGTIVGRKTWPGNGADNYGVGFTAGLRVVIPGTGAKTITKIGGWVATQSNPPTVEAFRFGISEADNVNNQNEETDVASRLYLSSSNILLSSVASSAGDFEFEESISISTSGGAVLFLQQICYVAGDIRFMYLDGQTGQRIYDGYYGGRSLPPADPQNSSELNYYDNFVYGIWIEVEDTGATPYSAKSVASISAGGVAKTILGLRQKSAAAGIISGGSKTQFSFNQKSPGGILLAGAAKLRLISKNVGVGLVSFSGVSKARFISSYFGVGASVVTGYSKASLQINTVTLSVISSGAFNFSGVAKLRSIYSQKSTSQLSASGFGVPRFAVRSASSGVIALGGLSREVYRFVGKSVGQFSANGFSKNRFVFKAASVSGGVLSGASKIRQITSYIGVGAGVVGGYSKATLALGVASISIVSVGNLVLAGKSQVTLLPAIDWFQNFSLTVYYKPADRRVKAIAEDRRISAVPLDRTVKFRF